MKKLVLCGTPEFIIPFFEALIESTEVNVIGIITRAPKEKNGKKLDRSPIAKWGATKKIKILEIKSINKDEETENLLKRSDYTLVFAYGQIISERVLNLPKEGFLNIHPSHLPDLRGPSPLQAAIMRGDIRTSLTLMKMNTKMDEGAIIAQKDFRLNPNHNIIAIFRELGTWGPNWVKEELLKYFASPKSKEQDQSKSTYCKLIQKEDFFIKEETPEQIINKIRALGYVFLEYKGVQIKCFLAKIYSKGDQINIKGVSPIYVQQPGKKTMHVHSFLNGYRD